MWHNQFCRCRPAQIINDDLFVDSSWNMEWPANPKDLLVFIDESKKPSFTEGAKTFYYTILFRKHEYGQSGSTYVAVDWDPAMEIQPKADPI